ncbi:N-terminal double-transmembrane domain-containing protein [Saprospira grandis DSM 2844]|uniref:N-terminal double-transmembrane domain-containing protein n=1 Tax=Saprospira grandis DSM 2844 TaxID=694433 RepID=J1I7N1_9BACT|nr:BatA domain-containing protein [Saprospira grandis]EJF54820.1 N-terminal double-transmembrane domain-containing protein [Saprospira grandis DSM 2844]
MSFLYPSFLWALLALIIPVIIHLFYFRRYKTVYFTNLRFLKEVKEQTNSWQRLRNLLVLMARMLALAALVFAFAQPYWQKAGGKTELGNHDVSIFFDNSYSMSAEAEDLRLLEKARRRAEEIVAAYGPNDRIQILSMDLEGRDQRLLSKEDALQRIREIQLSYQVQDMQRVFNRQKQALEKGENKKKQAFIISDFQKNSSDLAKIEADTQLQLSLVPLEAAALKNVAIDSAWFEAPVQGLNQNNRLFVKIRNYGQTDQNKLRLSLQLNGENRPIGSLDVPANSAIYDTISLNLNKTGWYLAELQLTDFPIEFDNSYRFSFYVKEKLELLELYEDQPLNAVAAAFSDDDYFEVKSKAISQLDYSKLPQNDLIILSQLSKLSSGLQAELKTYVEEGGKLLILPSRSAKLEDYNNFLQQLGANRLQPLEQKERKVVSINYQDFIFSDVYENESDRMKLPISQANFPLSKSARAAEQQLLRYRDGSSFLGKYKVKDGFLYLCSAPADSESSDLSKNGEVFVPMLYRMALESGKRQQIAYIVGQDQNLESEAQAQQQETAFKLGSGQLEFIPEQRRLGNRLLLGLNNQLQEAGFYQLYLNKEEVLEQFAFNYNRRESALEFYSLEELESSADGRYSIIDGNYGQDFGSLVLEETEGASLWKYFLILALLFLLLETLLLRLWQPQTPKTNVS